MPSAVMLRQMWLFWLSSSFPLLVVWCCSWACWVNEKCKKRRERGAQRENVEDFSSLERRRCVKVSLSLSSLFSMMNSPVVRFPFEKLIPRVCFKLRNVYCLFLFPSPTTPDSHIVGRGWVGIKLLNCCRCFGSLLRTEIGKCVEKRCMTGVRLNAIFQM